MICPLKIKLTALLMLLATLVRLHAAPDSGATASASIFHAADRSVTPLTGEIRDRIISRAVALLESARYEADAAVANEEKFQQVKKSARLDLTFAPARAIWATFSRPGPTGRPTMEITELIIPLTPHGQPDYLYVRADGKIRAFAKYAPEPAKALQAALPPK